MSKSNPTIVMARLLGCAARVGSINNLSNKDVGISMSKALANGQWSIALNAGTCLIHDCHAHISKGDLFFCNALGRAYCKKCIIRLRRDYSYIDATIRPKWVGQYTKLRKQHERITKFDQEQRSKG